MSNENPSFAFIILNYKTVEETKKCVEEILLRTNNIKNKKIVVVDNGSDNDDFRNLKKEYTGIDNILILPIEKNIGFANGNNYGYKRLLESNFTPDFTVFLNNDVYIVSNDFCEQIIYEYANSGFAVAGPRIILGNNTIDLCPFSLPSKQEVVKDLQRFRIISILSGLKIVKIYFIFERVKNLLLRFKQRSFVDKSKRKENVLLHGSCLIFSKKYFEYFKEPFDSRTFLYKEEEILFLRLRKRNILSVFMPNLVVFHRGGVSTVKGKSLNSLWVFRSKYYIQSLKILLEEM